MSELYNSVLTEMLIEKKDKITTDEYCLKNNIDRYLQTK